MSKQIVYILSNPAMPGYLKIGFTTRELALRLGDLDNTSVPVPFVCEYAREVDDARAIEKLLHIAFAHARTRSNREFFELPLDNAIAGLQLAQGRDIHIDSNVGLDKEDIDARENASRRRDRFSFMMVDIAEGTELYFYKDPNITWTVVANNKVLFEGQEDSLSHSALLVAQRLGFEWKSVSGPSCWCFDGETIEARRWRYENA